MNYADKEQLVKLVKHAQETGKFSVELSIIITKIAHGLAQRYKFQVDLDDFGQDCFLLLMKRIDNIRTDGNIFAYLTTLCWNEFRKKHRKQKHQAEKLEEYKEFKELKNTAIWDDNFVVPGYSYDLKGRAILTCKSKFIVKTMIVRAPTDSVWKMRMAGRVITEMHLERISNGVRKAYEEGRLDRYTLANAAPWYNPEWKAAQIARLRNSQPRKNGRWSLQYDCCQYCGTTKREHRGYGLCKKCCDGVNKRVRNERALAEHRCTNCFKKHKGEHKWCEQCLARRRKKWAKTHACVKPVTQDQKCPDCLKQHYSCFRLCEKCLERRREKYKENMAQHKCSRCCQKHDGPRKACESCLIKLRERTKHDQQSE